MGRIRIPGNHLARQNEKIGISPWCVTWRTEICENFLRAKKKKVSKNSKNLLMK